MFLKKLKTKFSCCNDIKEDEVQIQEQCSKQKSLILPSEIRKEEKADELQSLDEVVQNNPQNNIPFDCAFSEIKKKESTINKQKIFVDDEFSNNQEQFEQSNILPRKLEEDLKLLEKQKPLQQSSIQQSEWTDYQTIKSFEYNSENCVSCSNPLDYYHIQLSCNHNYCKVCLKQELKQQSLQGCKVFKCSCGKKIGNFIKGQDRIIDVLIEKLLINQLQIIEEELGKKYKIQKCGAQFCTYFCIIKGGLMFYCPQCE